jgi:hypothetical protein
MHLNAEVDLRDVPLGTFFLFFLNQDAKGGFTRLATMVDEYTIDAGHSFTYRLDELKLADGKLLTTKHSIPKKQPDLGKKELLVNDQTRVWKGEGGKQVKLTDLAVGDELLFNLTGKTAVNPGRCTDIWAGVETHAFVTEQQRKKFAAFVKFRGLPGWIDRTEGNKITLTLFSGDPKKFKDSWLNDFAVGKEISIVVANDELRTWNPGTDRERAQLLEVQKGPLDCYGNSGVRLVLTVSNMLEGFRKGRIVRVFGTGWPFKDQFYGEGLMNYGYSRLQTPEIMELTPKEYPGQFPFRTDYGNDQLPWYQLKSGVVPPLFSEHVVFGEIVTVDAAKRAGQFRTDGAGDLVDFALIPEGSVRYLDVKVGLTDLPLGLRCRFHLYQDEKGAFTKASLMSDEFSYLVSNAVTYRIEALKLDEGKLHVARQIPEAKDYNGDMRQPPDIGRTELLVNADTRVWKGDQQVKLTDLALRDQLLVNLSGESPGKPSRCTDIWVGVETHKQVTEQLRKKYEVPKAKKTTTKK